MKTIHQAHAAILGAVVFALLSATPASASAKKYIVGIVPQFGAEKTKEIWTPILEEIAEQTGHEFELVPSASIAEFEERLYQGEFDIAYSNPYQSLLARMKQGYEPLVRDRSRSLQGIVVVRRGAKVRTLADLNNKKLAFPAPNALAASLVLRAHMDRVTKIAVQSSFLGSHNKVYEAIAAGQVAAGGGVGKTLKKQPKELQDKLRVLYTSKKMAPHPVIAHPRIGRRTQLKVRKALLAMGKDEAGRTMLNGVPMKKIGKARPRDYKPLMYWGLGEYELKN